MIKVNIKKLDQLFATYQELASAIGEEFSNFKGSTLYQNTEKYKEELYNKAHSIIVNSHWTIEQIGSGDIHQSLIEAMNVTSKHKGKTVQNNLINHFSIKDNFKKLTPTYELEQTFYDFYLNNGISDSIVFERLKDLGFGYNLISYLFFIKDANTYIPISQEQFDNALRLMGIYDFKTNRNVTWENYVQVLEITSQVHQFLKTKDADATLLNAHSFLYTLSEREKKPIKLSETELLEFEKQIQNEADSEIFLEGKEKYKWHKFTERSSALVNKTKALKLAVDQDLRCEICNFSFFETYGELGLGFIEAHHVVPISNLKEDTPTKPEDLALVCSNCHRMLHRRRPWLSIKDLKEILKNKID